MKYFSIRELCASATASAHDLENVPSVDEVENLEYLVENVLDPLREFIRHQIFISSGYRSEEVNRLVGGVQNSQHKYGCAVDIVFREDEQYCTLVYLILTCPLMSFYKFIDQCILYQKQCFIHVSISEDRCPRHEFFVK